MDTKIEREIPAFQHCIMQENWSETRKVFQVLNFSFSKIMNNSDTVAKKDFTASSNSKKQEGFKWSTTKIWHEIKANVLTFWVMFFCEPCTRFSAKKMGFLQTL
jgi:hypothetical protein